MDNGPETHGCGDGRDKGLLSADTTLVGASTDDRLDRQGVEIPADCPARVAPKLSGMGLAWYSAEACGSGYSVEACGSGDTLLLNKLPSCEPGQPNGLCAAVGRKSGGTILLLASLEPASFTRARESVAEKERLDEVIGAGT